MKKTAVSLIVLLCLVAAMLASCSSGGDELPEGMRLATCAGADYRFYVPSTWNPNTSYGMSGAYYRFREQSIVSVQKYPFSGDVETFRKNRELDGITDPKDLTICFFQRFLYSSLTGLATGEVTWEEKGTRILDGVNAFEFECAANISGQPLRFRYVIGEKNEAYYVFSFSAVDSEGNSLYEALSSDVDKMLSAFCFSEVPYDPEDAKELSRKGNPPSGMKTASTEGVAYYFYVPQAWTVSLDERITSAYTEDRSSVSIVPYLPSGEGISIEDYFAEAEQLMLKTAGAGYERLSESRDRTFGGKNSLSYEYRYTVGGTSVRCLQVLTAHRGMIYSLTYTALPGNYDAHMAEVTGMLEAFTFR